MKIAILGTRGIPAAYGGFETLAWELSTRLAARGHEVTVYCRRGRTDESIAVPPGVRRRFLPYLPGKYLETVSHTALSALDSVLRGYDAIWLGNAANALVCGIPRLRGTRVVLNVDGIERQRRKWGLGGRLWYTLGERLSLHFPTAIVSDADVIRDYYRERYGSARPSSPTAPRCSTAIRRRTWRGTASRASSPTATSSTSAASSRRTRRTSSSAPIGTSRATCPLLIVGDAPYAPAFKALLAELAAADPRVRLTGAIYGDGYRDLQRAALAYIQATSVGGTHPALIEAMGAGNLVLAFGTPENVEVTAGTGLLFGGAEELAAHLRRVVSAPHAPEFDDLRRAARARAEAAYSWDAVTTQYEELWRRLGASG